jgi:transposase-like protein
MSVLSKPYFHDEAAAFTFVEGIIWAGVPVCPHCGCVGRIGVLVAKDKKGRERAGLKKCYDCRKQFTVRIGTIFEDSHLPLTKWLQAIYLMVSSKKGVSAHQMHRTLEITYKTAWFLEHRIREAMRCGALAPFGSAGGAVEVDETFYGREPGKKPSRGGAHKIKVLTLLDRETGVASSRVVDDLRASTIEPILREAIAKEARLMTDEAHHYRAVGTEFAQHGTTSHAAGEYVNAADPTIHSNTVEGYFGIFKRGMRGVYQKASKKHLHRYLAEFDFRYSNRAAKGVDDEARAIKALEGIVGKRLTYRSTGGRA